MPANRRALPELFILKPVSFTAATPSNIRLLSLRSTYVPGETRSPGIALPTQILKEGHETLRVAIRKWSKEHRVDHAENGGGGADAERQSEDGHDREARASKQRSYSVAHVIANVVDGYAGHDRRPFYFPR